MTNDLTYFKNCPTCGGTQSYATLKGLKVAIEKNRVCHSCSNSSETRRGRPCPEHVKEIVRLLHTGRKDTPETLRKRSISLTGVRNPMYGLKGVLCPNFGAKRTDEHKQYLSNLKLKVPISQEHRDNISAGLKGKMHSEETLKKMRLTKIQNIIVNNGGIAPRYNKRACSYFDTLEQEKKWNGLYATKNGEFYIKSLGYFVDYYEPSKNIVVEYDEIRHYNIDNTLKKRDNARMLEIIEHLKCTFYRYNERTKELRIYA